MIRTAQRSVAIVLASVLVMMSALCGLFGGGAGAQVLLSNGVAGVGDSDGGGAHHHGGAHEDGIGSVPVGLGHGSRAPSPSQDCVATCFESISSKLVPVGASITYPDFDAWAPPGGMDVALPTPKTVLLRVGYWPNGPPGIDFISGSGAQRLVRLNARLRN